MIRFETSFANVTLQFRHSLPSVTVTRNNDLVAMVNNLKIKQGSTECEITFVDKQDPTLMEYYFGKAFTHPGDQYKKETGRELSLRRAIEEAQLTDSQMRQIMVGYYSRSSDKRK